MVSSINIADFVVNAKSFCILNVWIAMPGVGCIYMLVDLLFQSHVTQILKAC